MKNLILLITFLFILLNGCTDVSGIQKETRERIHSHKQFIREISFKGSITDKIYCEKCNFMKYQIRIEFDEKINKEIGLSNSSFPPYYSFSSNKEITLSVSKELFDGSSKGAHIIKNANSNKLLILNKDYQLLSSETYKWIP